MKRLVRWTLVVAVLALPACVHHVVVDKLPPIQINANLNIRMEKAVEDFFSYENQGEEPPKSKSKGEK